MFVIVEKGFAKRKVLAECCTGYASRTRNLNFRVDSIQAPQFFCIDFYESSFPIHI